MDDPYAALGLSKSATADEIKAAYRKVARRDHPDLHPDDPEAEARFKAASAAHDLLKDPDKRALFDAGKIDASGAERADRGYYRDHAGGSGDPYSARGDGAGGSAEEFDAAEFFSHFAGGGFGPDRFGPDRFGGGVRGRRSAMRGADDSYSLTVPFLDAATGSKSRITLPSGNSLDVSIPAGAQDGTILRLRGKGAPGPNGGPPGDALITLRVLDDPTFTRDGDDILVTLSISIDEAILGGRVPVPTIDGPVTLSVPAGASSGQVLRLRGRGLARRGKAARGDQKVTLRIVAPPEIDDDLRAFMADWRTRHGYDPRKTRVTT